MPRLFSVNPPKRTRSVLHRTGSLPSVWPDQANAEPVCERVQTVLGKRDLGQSAHNNDNCAQHYDVAAGPVRRTYQTHCPQQQGGKESNGRGKTDRASRCQCMKEQIVRMTGKRHILQFHLTDESFNISVKIPDTGAEQGSFFKYKRRPLPQFDPVSCTACLVLRIK